MYEPREVEQIKAVKINPAKAPSDRVGGVLDELRTQISLMAQDLDSLEKRITPVLEVVSNGAIATPKEPPITTASSSPLAILIAHLAQEIMAIRRRVDRLTARVEI